MAALEGDDYWIDPLNYKSKLTLWKRIQNLQFALQIPELNFLTEPRAFSTE